MSICNFTNQQDEYIIGENAIPGKDMEYPELAQYATKIIEDIDRLVVDSGVKRTTIYNIKNGQRARPANYAKLSMALGVTRKEQREIYRNFMRFSGYPEFLYETDEDIDSGFDDLVLEEIKMRYPEIYEAARVMVRRRLDGDQPTMAD